MFRNIQTQKRSHESPMDFEWQSSSGPTDPSSPFPQFKGNPQKANFESPRPQSSQSSFISASSQPAPQFRNPSFTTPRKAFDHDLFSETSGIDSSPGETADGDDTPDPPKQIAMTAFSGDTVRKPIFGKYGAGFLGTSPSNAERRRGKYGNAIVSKMRKRKRIDRDYALIRGQRSDSETDSEDDARPSREKRKEKASKVEKEPGWFAGGLNYIESHPNLPSVLSYYAQLAVNTFIACLTIFGIYTFWTTVRADVDKASEHERGIVIAEIAKCARDYVENRCGNDVRLPALEMVCDNWELCMNRDPNAIGRARVSAHTFAQIFNSFIEPISYKAMIFIVATLILTIFANNMAFGMFRSKHQHDYQHQQPPSQSQFFPPTPHHQNSFQWGPPPPQTPRQAMEWEAYGANGDHYQAVMPSSQRSPSKGNRERGLSRSPSKGDRERY